MKRSPIRKVSKRRAKDNKLYLKLRDEYLEEHPVCERCGWDGTLQIHHRKGRLHKTLCDTKHWAALCLLCHHWVHGFPQKAREQGWLLDRIGKQL